MAKKTKLEIEIKKRLDDLQDRIESYKISPQSHFIIPDPLSDYETDSEGVIKEGDIIFVPALVNREATDEDLNSPDVRMYGYPGPYIVCRIIGDAYEFQQLCKEKRGKFKPPYDEIRNIYWKKLHANYTKYIKSKNKR